MAHNLALRLGPKEQPSNQLMDRHTDLGEAAAIISDTSMLQDQLVDVSQ